MKRLILLLLLVVLSMGAGWPRLRAKPTATMRAEPATIQAGQESQLIYATTNASSATIGTEKQWYTYSDPTRVPINGVLVVTPTQTTTYYLLARYRRFDLNRNHRPDGRRGGTWASATVTVIQPTKGIP